MKVAAIIINYNDITRTREQIKRLMPCKCIDKIVVVDNGSINQNEMRKISGGKVVVLFNSTNVGYGAGNNTALRYLHKKHYDYVLIMNNDIIIQEETIKGYLAFMKEQPKCAVVAARMIERNKIKRNFYDSPTLKNTLNFFSSTFSKSCKSMKHHGHYITANYVRESGALYDLHKFAEINFFDEHFFMYEEGPSTSFLFHQKGYFEAIILNVPPYIHNHCGPLINHKLFATNKKSRIYFFKNYLHYNRFKLFVFKIYWINIVP